jgi:hypothetical protein
MNNSVLKVVDGVATTVAGGGTPLTNNPLANPGAAAIDPLTGDLFIADTDNNEVDEVVESTTTAAEWAADLGSTVSVGEIVVIAGTGAAGYSAGGGEEPLRFQRSARRTRRNRVRYLGKPLHRRQRQQHHPRGHARCEQHLL